MDEQTIFLLERMDDMEERLVEKIDALTAFKNKLMGMAVIAGGVGSAVIEVIFKHL